MNTLNFNKMGDLTNEKLLKLLQHKIYVLNQRAHHKRNKKIYHVQAIRERTVATKFGKLTYKRYIYFYYTLENKKKYISLVDQKIGVSKYRKIHDELIEEIVAQLPTGKRYRDIQDMFPKSKISKMSISRIYQTTILKKNESRRINLFDNQNLYVNIDDCYVSVIKNGKKVKERYRVFSYYTGLVKLSKSRNKLLNKRTEYIITDEKTSIPTDLFVQTLVKKAKQHFKNFDNANLIIGGDGAAWIKNTSSMVNANYVLDKFHAIKYLRDFYIRGKNKYISSNWINYNIAKMYLVNGLVDELLLFLVTTDAPKKMLTYFKSNKQGIMNYKHGWNIGVSAESDVFRLVKSTLGTGSKIYNSRTLSNIVLSRSNSLNSMGEY